MYSDSVFDWLQYHILRQKGTEPAGAGKYNKVYDDGVYKCGGCGTPLYKCVALCVLCCACWYIESRSKLELTYSSRRLAGLKQNLILVVGGLRTGITSQGL